MEESLEPVPLTALVSDLMEELSEEPTATVMLTHLLRLVPEAGHISITMQRKESAELFGASSDLAERSETLQADSREGPSWEQSGDPRRSGDLGHDTRWPVWGPLAARLGLHSLLSIPMTTRAGQLGTLNFYSEDRGGFDDRRGLGPASRYANRAAHTLRSAQLVDELQTALLSRGRIGIALGMLMQRYDLEEEAAWAALKRRSMDRNVKVREVADEVIELRRLPE